MKKLLPFLIIALVCFSRNIAFAMTYPLSVTVSGSGIAASMTGVTDTGQYELVLLKAPFSTLAATNKQNEVVIDTKYSVQTASNNVVTWNISGLNPSTTFYIRVFRVTNGIFNWTTDAVTNTQVFVNGTAQTITSSALNFKTSLVVSGITITSDENQVVVQGKLDPAANQVFGTDMTAYSATLYVSAKPFQKDDDSQEEGRIFSAYNGLIDSTGNVISNTPKQGVGNDGGYMFLVNSLTPNTSYYYKQVIAAPEGTIKIERGGPFTSNGGYTPSGTATTSAVSADSKTYHLLAPWPGLSVLMDPDLCAQQKAAGKLPAGAVCDINGFLNFAFKTLIGLTAVALVLRLMFEGYQYMVTDVLFLKASAKSNFWSALFGLLIALSAYLILNTLNPKLVDNTITIAQVDVGIDGDTNAPTTFTPNGKLPSGVQCPKTGKSSSVAVIAQSFSGKVTYTYGGKDPSIQSDGTSHLDCSAYVNTVLNCAGYAAPVDYTNSGTVDIFSNSKAEKISLVTSTTVNGIPLKPGDLVGWEPGDHGDKYGHVLIYIGNGQVMDSHGGNGHPIGKAIGNTLITQLVGKISYIRRISN